MQQFISLVGRSCKSWRLGVRTRPMGRMLAFSKRSPHAVSALYDCFWALSATLHYLEVTLYLQHWLLCVQRKYLKTPTLCHPHIAEFSSRLSPDCILRCEPYNPGVPAM